MATNFFIIIKTSLYNFGAAKERVSGMLFDVVDNIVAHGYRRFGHRNTFTCHQQLQFNVNPLEFKR